MPGGRPTKYEPQFAEQATKLCLLGATNPELANFFGVAESTISKWLVDEPEFSEAVKEGRQAADAKVAESLYQQALAGNPTAQIFWLKNRRKENWRELSKVEKTVKGNVRHTHESVSDSADWVAEMLGGEAPSTDAEPRTH